MPLLAPLAGLLLMGELPFQKCPLFEIHRSKNANVVTYAARIGQEGKLDLHEPIDVHWRMDAEDGRQEGLNFLERLLAYGVRTELESQGTAGVLRLAPLPRRPIHVATTAGGCQALTSIEGTPARLTSIYVAADEGAGLPHVAWVELSGTRLSDGAPVRERLSAH